MAPERKPISSPSDDPSPGSDMDRVLAELREANERLIVAGLRLQQLADHARAAQDQAEAANHAKDEFLAAVSHELRTPLNAILGWTHLLRRGDVTGEAADRALETIERNAKLQTRLISDLLQVSQIVTGQLRLDVEPVDLAPLLTAAINSLQPAVTAKDIILSSHTDPGVARVLADPARVQQMIWNLVSNAIKFTPRNGTSEVALRQAGSAAEISVKDSGIGIEAAFVPYMFDRFRQADGTAHRAFGGLGLGLAIVRQLMELHGGTVKGESSGAGRGSTFTLTFPIPALTIRRDEIDFGISSPSLQGLRVLIVEDEADSRGLLAALLSAGGAIVTAVDSVPEALAQFDVYVPDLLIADIGLPHQDGYSLIRQVRGLECGSAARVPAVALTAHARAEDRDEALEAGFQVHIAKPVAPDEFVEAISALARRSKNRIG
ncbi:MAG: response regulator [Acidobacteria bacterium]|nr:response regulator [Acidobacteriota bacterium]